MIPNTYVSQNKSSHTCRCMWRLSVHRVWTLQLVNSKNLPARCSYARIDMRSCAMMLRIKNISICFRLHFNFAPAPVCRCTRSCAELNIFYADKYSTCLPTCTHAHQIDCNIFTCSQISVQCTCQLSQITNVYTPLIPQYIDIKKPNKYNWNSNHKPHAACACADDMNFPERPYPLFGRRSSTFVAKMYKLRAPSYHYSSNPSGRRNWRDRSDLRPHR